MYDLKKDFEKEVLMTLSKEDLIKILRRPDSWIGFAVGGYSQNNISRFLFNGKNLGVYIYLKCFDLMTLEEIKTTESFFSRCLDTQMYCAFSTNSEVIEQIFTFRYEALLKELGANMVDAMVANLILTGGINEFNDDRYEDYVRSGNWSEKILMIAKKLKMLSKQSLEDIVREGREEMLTGYANLLRGKKKGE